MNNSEFDLGQGAGHKLVTAFRRNGAGVTELEWLSAGKNMGAVMLLASGQAELAMKVALSIPPEVEEVIVRVERSIKPIYPDWMKEVLHPELEATGPAEFDAAKLELWLHDGQKASVVKGQVIYEHFKTNEMLGGCLGLRDLEEIQKKGITFFRKYFKGKAVFGWRSVVRYSGGYLCVPCLYGYRDVLVLLRWDGLDGGCDSDDPALRFAK